MTDSRFVPAMMLAMAVSLAASVPVRTQTGDGVLSVDDGRGARPIARLAGGRWVDDAKCFSGRPGASPAAPERLSATGEIPISQVRALAPGSPEWLRLLPSIVELFDQREREQRLSIDRTSD